MKKGGQINKTWSFFIEPKVGKEVDLHRTVKEREKERLSDVRRKFILNFRSNNWEGSINHKRRSSERIKKNRPKSNVGNGGWFVNEYKF